MDDCFRVEHIEPQLACFKLGKFICCFSEVSAVIPEASLSLPIIAFDVLFIYFEYPPMIIENIATAIAVIKKVRYVKLSICFVIKSSGSTQI